MKNILSVSLLLALAGCTMGDFGSRERFYEKGTIADICEESPELCDNDAF